ncbi:hypothetical protein [Micromonospora saelicesensis]|nr:hypothetical protein [Micromonospora saelicesensis]
MQLYSYSPVWIANGAEGAGTVLVVATWLVVMLPAGATAAALGA